MATTFSSSFMSVTSLITPPTRYRPSVNSSSQLSIPYFQNKIRKSSITACLDGKADKVLNRPGPAEFPRSPWESHDFSSSSSSNVKTNLFAEERITDLKKEVKNMMLSLALNDPFQELDFIDKIQRLGLAYHFQEEIKDSLQRIFDASEAYFSESEGDDCTQLHRVSLGFRLLRQAGYYILPDVFSKFKDGKGNFQSNLTSDIQCMLSLYQASYLGFNGETILDEAMDFTRKHLTSMVSRVSPWLASEIQRALEIPLQKTVARIAAKQYISMYEADESHNPTLLEMAKLDYNRVQLIHRKELNEVTMWWEDMNIRTKLPFEVRDRVVESYAVLMTVYFEPQYSFGRILMTKCNAMLTVLDDAFDMYGDLQELAPLVDAFQRWDSGVLDKSPEYVKVIFREVDDLTRTVDKEMMTRQQFNGSEYLKQEFKDYTKGLLDEAKVLFSKETPTLEEWLPISVVTMGLNILIVSGIMDLKELATKEAYDWVASNPKLIDSVYLIVRLWDDIGTYEWEQERGITLSAVTCCMRDFQISEAEAIKHIHKMITSSWKDMNQHILGPNPVPMSVLKIAFNMPQIMETYFSAGNDGYTDTNGQTKELISLMFVDPI